MRGLKIPEMLNSTVTGPQENFGKPLSWSAGREGSELEVMSRSILSKYQAFVQLLFVLFVLFV
jgi:hypothetical protein